jgi:putative ABC transport system ATP-binding protein
MPPSESSDLGGLAVTGLRLSYPSGGSLRQVVLAIESFSLQRGGTLGISGPSGAGKTSLLHALCGITRPDSGSVVWDGEVISGHAEADRDAWRRRHVGLVFQDVHLVPELSGLENVLLPLRFDRWRLPTGAAREAASLLGAMGIPDPTRPARVLSRGEQQRVALARALVREPDIIIADEPTASLDAESAEAVSRMLLGAAAERRATLIVASHDPALLDMLPRRARLESGRLTETPA